MLWFDTARGSRRQRGKTWFRRANLTVTMVQVQACPLCLLPRGRASRSSCLGRWSRGWPPTAPRCDPVWFLWEDGAFWWITGAYTKLPERLAQDPEVAIVIDTCDLDTGAVVQVMATGAAQVVPDGSGPGDMRKLVRYLGSTHRDLARQVPRGPDRPGRAPGEAGPPACATHPGPEFPLIPSRHL